MQLNESKLYNKKILNNRQDNQKSLNNNQNIKHYLTQNKENIDTNINNQNDVDDLISSELILDDINLQVDYDKIENGLKKLKANNVNKNNTKLKDNKNNSCDSFNCNNIQTEGDLYYYSEDDDKEKEKNNINNIKQSSLDLDKIEYGIDENGNPINIKQNNKNEKKKIIAYIIISDNPKTNEQNNYLVDLNGKKIPKMSDGDFNYLFNNVRIIIKNFDVQNPKLRIYGANQRYSSLCSELSLYHKKKKKIKNIFNIKSNKNINKKDILYQRKKLSNNKKIDNKSQNKSFVTMKKSSFINSNKLSNNKIDFINQTKEILIRTKNNDLSIKEVTNNEYKNNLSLKNVYLDNLKNGNKTSRDNEYIKTEINNYDFLSDKNIFINRLKENIYPRNHKRFNLLGNYRNNSNKLYSNSNNQDFNQYRNFLINNSTTNTFKKSFSYFLNNKINKNPLLKKNKSPKKNINTTIKNIEYNIKKIQKNIKNALQNIIIRNKKINRSFKQSENKISLKIYNSYNNLNNNSIIEIPKNNKKKTSFNNEIELNKKFKISTSPKKIIRINHSKCSVLSKQANDMIHNYSMNKSMTKRKENNYKYINYDEKIKNNIKKNKMHINKSLINSLRNYPINNSKKI